MKTQYSNSSTKGQALDKIGHVLVKLNDKLKEIQTERPEALEVIAAYKKEIKKLEGLRRKIK